MSKLIFGCGYLGERVAQRWLAAGQHVTALTRSLARAQRLAAAGVEPLVGDVADSGALPPLPDAETVLFAVGYDRASHHTLHEVYVAGLARVLAVLSANVKRFIYISSVGVYHQNGGEWVDEDSPCFPTRPGGQACLEAERLLQASRFAERAIILRAGGIYGPGRIPRRADLAAGKPIPAPPTGYVNLIHVNDLASIVLAAEEVAPPLLLAVTDGRPVLREEYYGELARLLGAPPPQFAPAAEGSAVAERAKSDKRVRNNRLRAALPLALAYPSYREGLRAILAAEGE